MNEIKVGDTILVEQAWEDDSGMYHDEYAKVLSIDENGDMKLKFKRKKINEYLKSATFNVKKI